MRDDMPKWQDYLLWLQHTYIGWTVLGSQTTGNGLADANEMMQGRYPGPYRVVEKHYEDFDSFGLELEFDDPKEKTLWLLKWP